MNRTPSEAAQLGPRIFWISLACSMIFHGTCTAEVYKWTDKNGQVHFGDQAAAPNNSTKMDIKVAPAPVPATKAEQTLPSGTSSPSSPQLTEAGSRRIDSSKVKPGCYELISQISKTKRGTNWEALYDKFNSSCSGIAYECNYYKSRPEKDRCDWVERKGSNILQVYNRE